MEVCSGHALASLLFRFVRSGWHISQISPLTDGLSTPDRPLCHRAGRVARTACCVETVFDIRLTLVTRFGDVVGQPVNRLDLGVQAPLGVACFT